MKKRILSIFTLLALLVACAVSISASARFLCVDQADLLTEEEEITVANALHRVSTSYACELVVVTADSLGGYSAQSYADDFYDENGYGYGTDYTGILLLVSMTEREWAMSTCGDAIRIFTEDGLTLLEEQVIPYLSSGDYQTAFLYFAKTCDFILAEAEDGVPYGSSYSEKDGYGYPDNYYQEDYYHDSTHYADMSLTDHAKSILVSLIIGFVLSLIVVSIMAKTMKSVQYQSGASSYEKRGSFHLTREKDLYLYRHVTRIRKESQSSHHHHGGGGRGGHTHRSSSGRSHGGRSGRF